MKKLVFIICILLISCKLSRPILYITPVIDQTFNRPYTLKIINEHEVQCIWKTDTVRLYFENAYKLNEETLIFIKKETK